jgi:hypothetical protein
MCKKYILKMKKIYFRNVFILNFIVSINYFFSPKFIKQMMVDDNYQLIHPFCLESSTTTTSEVCTNQHCFEFAGYSH